MMTVAEAIAEYTRMLDLLDSEPTYNTYFSEDREVLLGGLTAEQQDQVLASTKMVYTYQVTLTLDLMVEPVVTYHTILAGIRESRFSILLDHFRRAPRVDLRRHVLIRARKALPSDLALAAELEKRGYPKHWLALGVSAETPEALMFLCA
jgi:hypothetical protein